MITQCSGIWPIFKDPITQKLFQLNEKQVFIESTTRSVLLLYSNTTWLKLTGLTDPTFIGLYMRKDRPTPQEMETFEKEIRK